MTPTQRAAAERLADSLEWLLRNCADPDSYPMSMCKETAVLLRELAAGPVQNSKTQLQRAADQVLAAWDAAENQPIGCDRQSGRDYWSAMFAAIDALRKAVKGTK